MREYIILNGVSSSTIAGLLISTIPPISKPKIRAEIEEIDGRDGDIVTTLGYSAYDKEFTIGLYGNYDIDQIIEYFNSSGTVTFPNEPDKYYNYQILEQIDFEKLLRYKTATVRMHVQPFKYSLTDNSKNFNVDGTNLVDITSLVGYRNLNGIPTTETTDIVATSFDSTDIDFSVNANSYLTLVTNTLELEPNTTYTLSYIRTDTNINSSRTYIYDVSDEDEYTINPAFNTSGILSTGIITTEFTTGSNGKIALGFGVGNTSSGGSGICANITIYQGTNSNNVVIRNAGNIYSRPIITIEGSGTIRLYLNGVQMFEISLADIGSITIDTNLMEAYQGNTLLNRIVIGDYDNFKLNVGKNTITWSGNVTEIDIDNYSRWI